MGKSRHGAEKDQGPAGPCQRRTLTQAVGYMLLHAMLLTYLLYYTGKRGNYSDCLDRVYDLKTMINVKVTFKYFSRL